MTEGALKRLIAKKGIQYVIEALSSSDLSEDIKSYLEKYHYIVDGYLNLSLLYSLA